MFLIQKQWKHSVNHAKQRRNPFESIRKIWGHDWRVNVSYVLAHVFERVSTRPRLFQSDTTLHGAHYGVGHGVRHVAFHVGMYKNKKLNAIILGTSALVFGLSLWLVRSQTTVDDVSWMKAMIPHHSIAILTSERAEIEDPRVKQLSEEIINAQEREIAEMKRLIEELEKEEEQAKTDMQVHAKTDRSE